MPKVRRANVILTVGENEIDKYLARGYDVIDNSGKVIKSPIPNDVNTLKKAYTKHMAEIQLLKDKIAQLESQSDDIEKPKRIRQRKVEES